MNYRHLLGVDESLKPVLSPSRTPLLKRRWFMVLTMLAILFVAFWGVPAVVRAADPSGVDTFNADPNSAVNMIWTLIAGFLVWFMQLGFAFLGGGLIRAKNQVNYWTKSFMDFGIASLGFWAFGFALMFGGSKLFPGLDAGNSFIGYTGFFLSGDSYDVSTIMFWFFQMVFAATAATIVAGAVAERMKITAYLGYSFIIGALIYPIYGKWVWGGGWLGDLNILGASGGGGFCRFGSGPYGWRAGSLDWCGYGRAKNWEIQ